MLANLGAGDVGGPRPELAANAFGSMQFQIEGFLLGRAAPHEQLDAAFHRPCCGGGGQRLRCSNVGKLSPARPRPPTAGIHAGLHRHTTGSRYSSVVACLNSPRRVHHVTSTTVDSTPVTIDAVLISHGKHGDNKLFSFPEPCPGMTPRVPIFPRNSPHKDISFPTPAANIFRENYVPIPPYFPLTEPLLHLFFDIFSHRLTAAPARTLLVSFNSPG